MKKVLSCIFLLGCISQALLARAQKGHPVVHLGSILSNSCTKAEILSNPVLVAQDSCEVLGFDFSYMPEEPRLIHVKGSRLTNEIIEIIKLHIRMGTRIFIEGIVVKCHGKPTWAEPIYLKIDL